MAFYCPSRQCYVARKSNKRLRGMWRVLSERVCPPYVPPRGFGRRSRHSGLDAGKALDEAVTAIVGKDQETLKDLPRWALGYARKIVDTMARAKIGQLRSQVVVHDLKKGLATAIDLMGVSSRSRQVWIVEIKYCGHPVENVKRMYKRASIKNPTMKRSKQPNSLYERHRLQARETVKMYRKNTGIAAQKIEAGVLVCCGCGSLLWYRVY